MTKNKTIRAYTLLAALAATAIMPVAAAGESKAERIYNQPFSVVAQLHSEASEPFASFVERVSTAILSFTDETGHEACGEFAMNPNTGTYGVIVTTSHSHIACITRRDVTPSEMVPISKNIHSHSGERTFVMNAADLEISKAMSWHHKNRKRGFTQDRYHFSETDIASNSTYLATPRGPIGGP